MRRKWMVLVALSLIGTVAITGTAWSANVIKLVVNGREITSEVPPQIIDGSAMVPIRAASEALGAVVEWDPAERSVTIGTEAESESASAEAMSPDEQASLQRQIELLRSWIAPDSAEAAVRTWAEAVRLRNGAVQFAALSADLQEQTQESYEQVGGWTTGVSSPWVSGYAISHEPSFGDDGRYIVTFETATSTGYAGSAAVAVDAEQADSRWVVGGLRDMGGASGIAVLPAGASAGVSDFADKDNGYIAWQDAQGMRAARTQDGGRQWEAATVAAGDDHPLLMTFVGKERGWLLAVGDAGMHQSRKTVFRTEDGGATWKAISGGGDPASADDNAALPRVGYPTGLVFRDDQTGFVTMDNPVSDELLFFRTTDGGSSWQPVALDTGAIPYDFASIAAPVFSGESGMDGRLSVTFTAGEDKRVVTYRTTDGGATWVRQTSAP